MTGGLAALPALFRAVRAPSFGTFAWAIPLGIFAAAFLYALGDSASKPRRRVALLIESVAALAFTTLGRGGFAAGLCVVVAGQAPFMVASSAALAFVAAQTVALVGIFSIEQGSWQGLFPASGYLGFQLFALGAAYLAEREAKARAELALANAELLATRDVFAAATRSEERLRIARDLHDAMGHHLTALRLQLEVAKNSTGEKHQAAVDESSGIAKMLLDEVREVVTTMRDPAPLDLPQALAHLVAAVPRPKVSLVIDPALRDSDAPSAHAMFRFVQEALTNAARHAEASVVFVELARDGDALRATARDDGKGAENIREGNGLRGLRERLEALGGKLDVVATAGGGTELRAELPWKERPA